MIAEQYARAKRILTEHKEGHNKLAEQLIEREVIFAEDVEKIFGKRPWVSRSEEILEESNGKATDNSGRPDGSGKSDNLDGSDGLDNPEGLDTAGKSDNSDKMESDNK